MKTDNFIATLVCLETGQEITTHPEPYGVCFCVISGRGLFTVGKEQSELSKGQMVFAPAD